MATYRKDRNFIIISLNEVAGNYRLDINTGILYGVKGNPIKTCPHKNEVRNMFSNYRQNNSNLEQALYRMIDNCTATSQYARYASSLLVADKVDGLGAGLLDLYGDHYTYVGDHIKELVTYLKDENNTNSFNFHTFKAWCDFEKVKKSLGSVANLLTAEMYSEIINRLPNITAEELGVCAYYLVRGKYWEYHNGRIGNLIQYIETCRLMEQAPQKVNNFMREYCETMKIYNLRKTEFDNKKLAFNYAKHAKAWEFEYGDYVVSIPTCGQDIVTEGKLMHHCVGGYVQRVVDNDCYICFIRHKDTPTTPYITCQVYLDGRIGQYFLAYDRYISSDEDIAFKSAFANHLAEVWG